MTSAQKALLLFELMGRYFLKQRVILLLFFAQNLGASIVYFITQNYPVFVLMVLVSLTNLRFLYRSDMPLRESGFYRLYYFPPFCVHWAKNSCLGLLLLLQLSYIAIVHSDSPLALGYLNSIPIVIAYCVFSILYAIRPRALRIASYICAGILMSLLMFWPAFWVLLFLLMALTGILVRKLKNEFSDYI